MEKIEQLLEHAVTLKRVGSLKKHAEYDDLVILTEFLPKSASVSQRLWHARNKIFSIPKCKMCVRTVTWDKLKGGKYRTYCSSKCSHSDISVLEKIANTNKERYGHVTPIHNVDIQQTIKSQWIKKYGVDNPAKSQEVKNKKIKTAKDNWGVSHPMQNSTIQNKVKQTSLEKYGHTNVLCSEYGKNKSQKTLQTNYNVNYPQQSPIIKERIKQIHLDKYGRPHNWCSGTESRNKQIQTMIKKYGTISVSVLNKKTLTLLNNRDWLITQHEELQKPLYIIGQELGVDGQTISNYCKKHNIKIKNNSASYAEHEINEFILSLGFNTERNVRYIIPPYELDIYVPVKNLAIEFCGLYWHSEQQGKDRNYHVTKYQQCFQKNIRLLTIFDDEWINKKLIVQNIIRRILEKDISKSVYARQTTIHIINTNEYKTFLNNHSIYGFSSGSVLLGLTNNNELIAVIGFKQRKPGIWELVRYATSCKVPGGFSKLLTHFEQNYNWKQIISFADLRLSVGNLYSSCGFIKDKTIPPDYYYSPDGHTRIHKFNYRRKELSKRLKYFNPLLSERVNCDNNGILRIWDCGKQRWIKVNNA